MEDCKGGTGHRAWGMEVTWIVVFGCQRSDIRSQRYQVKLQGRWRNTEEGPNIGKLRRSDVLGADSARVMYEGWRCGRLERWKGGRMEDWKDGKMEGGKDV